MSTLLSERQAQLADRWRDAKVDRIAATQRFRNCRNCTWAQHVPALPPTATDPAEDEWFKCPAKGEGWSISGHELDMYLKDNAWGCHLWEAKGED